MNEAKDRRARPTLRETLTYTKEVPLAWLITFLCGGLGNLAILTWMAATLVADVNSLKENYKEVRINAVRIDGVVSTQAADVQRATDINNAQNARLDDHSHRIERIEDRERLRR